MRSQIELYKIHHNDELPGMQGAVDFTTAMTSLTNQDGVVDTFNGADPTYKYGPYMREIPINPFNDLKTVLEQATKVVGQGSDLNGWIFVNAGVDAGLFQADDDNANPMDAADWHTGY